MPVVNFIVTWPDGTSETYSSPSRAIMEFIHEKEYRAVDFAQAVKAGLDEASLRVQKKFGFACSAAAEQWHRLDQRLHAFEGDEKVHVAYGS
jgi:uncharacterized repeat protein (TIGR04042 family)